MFSVLCVFVSWLLPVLSVSPIYSYILSVELYLLCAQIELMWQLTSTVRRL